MRFLDLFTSESLAVADRLRSLSPSVGSDFTVWELLAAAEEVEVMHGYETDETLVALYRTSAGRWGRVEVDLPFSRNADRRLQWYEHNADGQRDLFFRAYLNRTETETLPDLFDALSRRATVDPGSFGNPSVASVAVMLILGTPHPDAEPVRVLWALGSHPALQAALDNEDINPAGFTGVFDLRQDSNGGWQPVALNTFGDALSTALPATTSASAPAAEAV